MRATTGIVLLLACLPVPLVARAACAVEQVVAVPLDIASGTIAVEVAVNGSAATLILDTGAQRSVVTPAAVQRLRLARDEWAGTAMRGIGGIETRPNADPDSLTLGGVPLVRRTLNRDISLAVGDLPRTHIGTLFIDGLLGRDFLAPFDLDLDVPRRRLTLYRVNGCSGRFLPWTGGYTAEPIALLADNAVVMPVTVDDTPLRAILDTGASASVIAAPGLFRLGLPPGGLPGDPADPVSGLGPRTVTMHRHVFRSLRAAGQTTTSPTIQVAPIHTTPIADMLLGADWLADRRVWISFATRQVFVAAP